MSPTSLSLVASTLLAVLAGGAVGSSVSAQLLGEAESGLAGRRTELEDWCQHELQSQEQQRAALLKLRSDLGAGDEDADQPDAMPPMLLQEEKASSAKDEQKMERLDLEVKCLAEVETELSSKEGRGRWLFGRGESRGLRAVRRVLGKAQVRQQRLEEKSAASPVSLARDPTKDLEEARAKQRKLSEAVASRRAAALAARSGRQVLDAALAKTEAALSDAAGICGLGRSVIGRMEEASRPLVQQALELIGRVEGAEGAVQEATELREARAPPDARALPEEELPAELQRAPLNLRNFIEEAMQKMLGQQAHPHSVVVEELAPPAAHAQIQFAMPDLAQAPQEALGMTPQQMLQQQLLQQLQQPMRQQLPMPEPSVAQPLQPQQQELGLVQQLQQQQKQLQQQLLELQQAKAAPPPTEAPPTAPREEPELDLFAPAPAAPAALQRAPAPLDDVHRAPALLDNDLHDTAPHAASLLKVDPAAPPQPPAVAAAVEDSAMRASPATTVQPALSLAAEAEAEIKSEKSQAEKIQDEAATDKPVESAVHPHDQTPAASHADQDADAPMPEEKAPAAPASFPASLRGGWQGLLAKKREENKNKPKKPDQASAIMELMETPKTYTAWQPDKASSESAGKAKSDLLAAEKAFDADDDDKPMDDKRASGRSLLQLNDGLGWKRLDDDLGGSDDPLAFFQFNADVYSAPNTPAMASDVLSALLGSFGHELRSMALLELSKMTLSKDDLEKLSEMDRLGSEDPEEHRDLQAEKMCQEYTRQKEEAAQLALEADSRAILLRAEARAEAQVLRHEVAARERLAQAFGKGSQSLLSLKDQLQRDAQHEQQLLSKLHVETAKLRPAAAAAAPEAMTTLEATLTRLDGLGAQGEDELEDALAGAAARRAQAEQADAKALSDLKSKISQLDKKGLEPAEQTESAAVEKKSLDEMCAWARESIKARNEKQEGEKLAIRSALAVLKEMAGP